jgi:hypothetical protein
LAFRKSFCYGVVVVGEEDELELELELPKALLAGVPVVPVFPLITFISLSGS